jgi:hypothetical protein
MAVNLEGRFFRYLVNIWDFDPIPPSVAKAYRPDYPALSFFRNRKVPH